MGMQQAMIHGMGVSSQQQVAEMHAARYTAGIPAMTRTSWSEEMCVGLQ